MMSAAQSPVSRAWLVVVAPPHSGGFLNEVPCSSVVTLLDNLSFRIRTALHLVAPVCTPHVCVCEENIDQYGVHGLSCPRSAGRHLLHSAVSVLVKCTLSSGDSRWTGAFVSDVKRWQASRWLDSGAMITHQVLGVKHHMS